MILIKIVGITISRKLIINENNSYFRGFVNTVLLNGLTFCFFLNACTVFTILFFLNLSILSSGIYDGSVAALLWIIGRIFLLHAYKTDLFLLT